MSYVLPNKFMLEHCEFFTAQMLPNNISQMHLPVFLVKTFSKTLTKNTWIIFGGIKIKSLSLYPKL